MSTKNRIRKEWDPNAWAWARKDIKIKKTNIVAEHVCDYCSHSSLHGIAYLGSKDITFPEKIWWLTIFLSSLCVCLYLISATWVKWQQNPVILSFEKEQTLIWAIPFPAVTVCPINKVQENIYNYTDKFARRDSLPADEYKKFWDISLVCSLEQYAIEVNSSIDITDHMAVKNILEVAPEMWDTIHLASWQHEANPDLFADHLNKEGLCFTFNAFSHDDMFTSELDSNTMFMDHQIKNTNWSIENGYSTHLKTDYYPRRTAQDGFGSGLSFFLTEYLPDIDYICGLPISGYKVILHNPVETAKAAQQYFLIDLNKKATIMVKPELITTSPSLRHLPARIRKCYFSNEKSLRFFKVYTQNNCRIECIANVTENYCGCVPFYLPRDNNTPICGFGKLKCIKIIEKKILYFEILEKSKASKAFDKTMQTAAYKIYDKCDCLPGCNSIHYTAEISSTNFRINNVFIKSGLLVDVPKLLKSHLSNGTVKASHVDIFFKESQFLSLQRTELHNQTDFIANCGGLLGLFMGFSVLSLVEIIYYITLRLWCKVRHRKSNNNVFISGSK